MTGGVKGIFKILLGVIVLTTVGCMVVEYMNMQIYAPRLSQIMRESLQASCQYYEQETYKEGKSDVATINAGNTYDLCVNNDNTSTGVVITGEFYKGSTPEEVYKNMYNDNESSTSDFVEWCESGVASGTIDGTNISYNDRVTVIDTENADENSSNNITTEPCTFWENLRDIYCYYAMSDDSDEAFLEKGCGNVDSMSMSETRGFGKQYVEQLMTPLNLGVAYVDHNTLNRIFRWTSVSMLANGVKGQKEDAGKRKTFQQIKIDKSGIPYVDWNGFRVYLQESNLYLDNISYTICDCRTDNGKNTVLTETNIDTNALYSALDDERLAIMLDRLSYHIDVTYEGITPLRGIMQWFLGANNDNQRKVAGYEKDKSMTDADGNEYGGNSPDGKANDNGFVYDNDYVEQNVNNSQTGNESLGAATFLDKDTDELNFTLTSFMDIRYYIIK